MKQEYFLAVARQASCKSDHHSHKMGCVIAKGNKILGVGHNVLKTHPKSPHKYKSIHAEFMAAINAGYDIEGATAYIFREQKDGTWAMAKPCDYCWKFLMELGVKEVVYSFEGSFKQERVA
jgi:deoxycytidylate deaminase